MNHSYHKPQKELTEYVRTILILEGSAEPDHNVQPIFTTSVPALFCQVEKNDTGNENIVKLSLFGKLTPPDAWTINQQTTIIAYFFRPIALASLFNISYKKLMTAPIDLCNWSPHVYNALRNQLVYSSSLPQKVEVLDNLIIQQLHQNRRECEIIKHSTDQIMLNSSTEILSVILKELNLNERTFQRIFKKYVGVTPTQYRRICQFQHSFSQLRLKPLGKISNVAFDNGFADQSHFNRSFKEFTNTTPTEYLKKGL